MDRTVAICNAPIRSLDSIGAMPRLYACLDVWRASRDPWKVASRCVPARSCEEHQPSRDTSLDWRLGRRTTLLALCKHYNLLCIDLTVSVRVKFPSNTTCVGQPYDQVVSSLQDIHHHRRADRTLFHQQKCRCRQILPCMVTDKATGVHSSMPDTDHHENRLTNPVRIERIIFNTTIEAATYRCSKGAYCTREKQGVASFQSFIRRPQHTFEGVAATASIQGLEHSPCAVASLSYAMESTI
jgi:hypothetical protein